MKNYVIESQAIKKQQFGLTLIELIMTMVIVGILASVAVPSFSSMNAAQEVAGVAQKIQQDLLFARSEAIKQNTNIHLSFATGTSWCYGFTDSGAACNCATANSCEINTKDGDANTDIEKTVSASSYRNISLSTGGTLSLNGANFNPTRGSVERSGAALNDGSITVSRGSNSATVNINILGRSSICSSSLGQFSDCL